MSTSFSDPIVLSIYCQTMMFGDDLNKQNLMDYLANHFSYINQIITGEYAVICEPGYLAEFRGIKYTYKQVISFKTDKNIPWVVAAEESGKLLKQNYMERCNGI